FGVDREAGGAPSRWRGPEGMIRPAGNGIVVQRVFLQPGQARLPEGPGRGVGDVGSGRIGGRDRGCVEAGRRAVADGVLLAGSSPIEGHSRLADECEMYLVCSLCRDSGCDQDGEKPKTDACDKQHPLHLPLPVQRLRRADGTLRHPAANPRWATGIPGTERLNPARDDRYISNIGPPGARDMALSHHDCTKAARVTDPKQRVSIPLSWTRGRVSSDLGMTIENPVETAPGGASGFRSCQSSDENGTRKRHVCRSVNGKHGLGNQRSDIPPDSEFFATFAN